MEKSHIADMVMVGEKMNILKIFVNFVSSGSGMYSSAD